MSHTAYPVQAYLGKYAQRYTSCLCSQLSSIGAPRKGKAHVQAVISSHYLYSVLKVEKMSSRWPPAGIEAPQEDFAAGAWRYLQHSFGLLAVKE